MSVTNITSAETAWQRGVPGPAQGAMADQGQDRSRQATTPATGRQIGDRVALSAAGRVAAPLLASLESFDSSPQAFQENSAAFQAELGKRFRAAGLDDTRPLDLTVDAEGAVRVANDHPDKDRIEALFAGDPDLSNQFRHLSASASLQKAIEEHVAFAEAYDKDPQTAIARYAYLFDDS